jgi:Holliday junction resolvase RusA-like endonuclease
VTIHGYVGYDPPGVPETCAIVVPGMPRGKGRPRFGRGRAYTPAGTVEAEGDVVAAWLAAGSPRVEGPVALEVELRVPRPRSHWLRSGDLSAEGRRHPVPVRKPDLDNALKLVMDALANRAWGDDACVVTASVRRVWAGEAATVVRWWRVA